MRKSFQNKKGFLLASETLKIILAVICIAFLVYLLVAIYFSVTGNEKLKQAQSIVNGEHGLAKEVERINLGGEPNAEGFHVPNPSDWWIFSFVGGEGKPNSCAGSNCICICEGLFLGIDLVGNSQIKRCDEKGACFAVSNIKKFEGIQISGQGIWLLMQKAENEIEVKKK